MLTRQLLKKTLLLSILATSSLYSARWVGGAEGIWNTDANWFPSAFPPSASVPATIDTASAAVEIFLDDSTEDLTLSAASIRITQGLSNGRLNIYGDISVTADSCNIESKSVLPLSTATTTCSVSDSLTFTMSGNISGGGNFTRGGGGDGTLILSGASNTYEGVTTVSNGTLRVTRSLSGTSAVIVNTSTTLQVDDASISANIANGGAMILNPGTSVTSTHSGNISGSGSITKSGVGTAVLSGTFSTARHNRSSAANNSTT